MKKLFVLFFALMLALNFAACSDGSSTPPAAATDDAVDPLADYTSTDITYSDGTTIKGYSLDQFVTEATVNAVFSNPTLASDGVTPVDCRKLYNYRVIGSDGYNTFDNKTPPKADLSRDLFNAGYLLEKIYDAKAYFPWTDDTTKFYNIKNAATANMYRIINVIKDADGTPATITFEMSSLASVDLSYWNTNKTEVKDGKGILLTQLLSDYVIDESVDKSTYSYKVNCADGYVANGASNTVLNNTLTWALYQVAYYIYEEDGLLNDKVIMLGANYDDGAGNNYPTQEKKSIKLPESIQFVNNTAGNDNPIGDDDGTATAPAQAATANYDLQFSFPEQ